MTISFDDENLHSQFPSEQRDPITGPTVNLEVSEIEDAGIREVLQTPGAAYGAWSILDALLTATGPGTPFIFKEPLGQAREVKVALSGLFGRFIARAYLERYFGLSIFAHLRSSSLVLDGRRHIEIVRLARGDLPDWIACAADLTSLTVAEAKGCHDFERSGEDTHTSMESGTADRCCGQKTKGNDQAHCDCDQVGDRSIGPTDAYLSVHDPVDEGEPIEHDDRDAVFIGLFRQHIANLVAPLSHEELATSLLQLAHNRFQRTLQRDVASARVILDATPVHEIEGESTVGGLVGGFVTRSGPLTEFAVAVADQHVLARLNLRPVFVGIERDLIRAAIDGEAETIRKRLTDGSRAEKIARTDRAGGWIIPLGSDQRTIRSL